jgi:hypothetical protein
LNRRFSLLQRALLCTRLQAGCFSLIFPQLKPASAGLFSRKTGIDLIGKRSELPASRAQARFRKEGKYPPCPPRLKPGAKNRLLKQALPDPWRLVLRILDISDFVTTPRPNIKGKKSSAHLQIRSHLLQETLKPQRIK